MIYLTLFVSGYADVGMNSAAILIYRSETNENSLISLCIVIHKLEKYINDPCFLCLRRVTLQFPLFQ